MAKETSLKMGKAGISVADLQQVDPYGSVFRFSPPHQAGTLQTYDEDPLTKVDAKP